MAQLAAASARDEQNSMARNPGYVHKEEKEGDYVEK
jgi:hypothetical protein